MARKRLTRIGALVAGFLMIGLVGFGIGGFAGAMGHGFPGGAMHLALAGLIDDLELTPEQQLRVDAVHEILHSHFAGKEQARNEHHQWLFDHIAAGDLDAAEVRANIDLHLDEARTVAYEVADELVPLVNSLDEAQRATLIEFAERAHGTMGGHGCGGPGADAHGPAS